MPAEHRCKYPKCGEKAPKTWAQVPLCDDHYNVIHAETQHYYAGRNGMGQFDRLEYLKIATLIPWSRVNMEDKPQRDIVAITCYKCGKKYASNWIDRHRVGCKGGENSIEKIRRN